MPGVQYVDLMKQKDYKELVNELGGELQEFHKSCKRFDSIILSDMSQAQIDSLAQKLEEKGKLTCFYMQRDGKVETSLMSDSNMQELANIGNVFKYISCFVRKKGDCYNEFVYIITVNPANIAMVVYAKGKLKESQLKFALPQIGQ